MVFSSPLTLTLILSFSLNSRPVIQILPVYSEGLKSETSLIPNFCIFLFLEYMTALPMRKSSAASSTELATAQTPLMPLNG